MAIKIKAKVGSWDVYAQANKIVEKQSRNFNEFFDTYALNKLADRQNSEVKTSSNNSKNLIR